jgi:hypothetical protein
MLSSIINVWCVLIACLYHIDEGQSEELEGAVSEDPEQ